MAPCERDGVQLIEGEIVAGEDDSAVMSLFRSNGGSECGGENLAIFFGESFGFAVAAADHVSGFAGGEEMVVVVAQKFVGKADAAVASFGDAGADAEAFVVARGMKIAALRFGDHDVAIVLRFPCLVFEAERAHELDAADFEPD